jgi:hypothetical protein
MDPHIHHRQNDEPLADELVSAYLDGELTAAEQAQIEERMAVNPEFRHLVEELRGLRNSFDILPQHRLPSDFAERVLRRAEQEMLLGATDLPPSNPAPVSPLVKLAKVDETPSPDFDGEPVPITLPARPPVEEQSHRRAGFRPFVWTMIAAAAALLILITNRQPDVRDVPIAKSPEAEQKARETTEARGEADTIGQRSAKESENAPDESAATASAGRSLSDTRRSGRDLTEAEESQTRLEKAPALQPALPAPDGGKAVSIDRGDRLKIEPAKEDSVEGLAVPPVPLNARGAPSDTALDADKVINRLEPAADGDVRSRSSASGDETRVRDFSGRAAELRRPAPADGFRKGLRDAADDAPPLDVKASEAFSDSAEKREKPGEAGARPSQSSTPAGKSNSPQPTAEAGVESQEQVGNALTRELDRKDSVETLQEDPRSANQPAQLSAATAAGDVLVVQVMLTPDAARQGAFATVLAQNSIRLEDDQLRQADEQETVLGAPAAGPATAYDRDRLERFGQQLGEARSVSEGDKAKSQTESIGRSARANLGGKASDVLQTAPPATRSPPDDPNRAGTSRGRNVRVQQSLGKDIQPAEPSPARDKEQAAPENAVREHDADSDKKKLKAGDGTALLADGERLYFERNVAPSTDLDVVVVTASDEQINGTLAALQAQQDLFPSVHVASGLGLSSLTIQQSPGEVKAPSGATSGGLGGFGGGASKEPPIQTPSEFRRRLSSSGSAPAQPTPGALGESNVEEKLEKAELETTKLSVTQKKEDAQSRARTTNGALPQSAGGGEAGATAKYVPSFRSQAQPPPDLNGGEALDVADAPATGFGVARRMRLESISEILRAQRQKPTGGVQFGATAVPATEPLKAELGVEAAETSAAKPADASDSQRSGDQTAQQRQRFAEAPQALTKSKPANESNEPAAAELKDAALAPRDRESRAGREGRADVAGAAPGSAVRLEGNLSQRRGGYPAPQAGVVARSTLSPQPQRQVLFVFRVAEPAIAGQSGATAGAGTVLRGAETAREAAGEAQIERAPAAPAPPAPSPK